MSLSAKRGFDSNTATILSCPQSSVGTLHLQPTGHSIPSCCAICSLCDVIHFLAEAADSQLFPLPRCGLICVCVCVCVCTRMADVQYTLTQYINEHCG
jgi:hypothetical protein